MVNSFRIKYIFSMINKELIKPQRIVVVGGSENKFKPGGKVLENLLNGNYNGEIYVINPKTQTVQGIKSYNNTNDLPHVDLAILAIPAKFCFNTIKDLTKKGTKAFIILSAGFGELNEEGKKIEQQISDFADKNNISILGPNCIGIINKNFKGVFTTPVPVYNPKGVDFISSSGSTAVFVMEAGIKMGMQFSSIYSVGNAIQIKVEDILEYFDKNYISGESSNIIMIYIEQLSNPAKLLKHSISLNKKGCNIIAVKAGLTQAGSRAASSHTGAMASPEIVVETLFKKAGIIQCYSREEMLYVAGVLFYGKPKGKNVAVITHAGGAGVMCADALEKGGMKVPELKNENTQKLLEHLHQGSSASNPIDFLATGSAEQMGLILDYCNYKFNEIDESIVIFGSPGLFDVEPVYDLLSNKIDNTIKPIYPVLPSPVNTEKAIEHFISKGKIFFPDESVLATAIAKIYNTNPIFEYPGKIDIKPDKTIRNIIKNAKGRYLTPYENRKLLQFAGIEAIDEYIVKKLDDLILLNENLTFPIAMKTVGPIHKTDIGGVVLNINNIEEAKQTFDKLIKIPDCTAVLIQPMITGIELYAGSIKEKNLGHIVMTGMGGIYLETLKDISTSICPIGRKEAETMIKSLKSYPVLKGKRGKKSINFYEFQNIIVNLSKLLTLIPEISEMDINPLIATGNSILAVDCRIKIET